MRDVPLRGALALTLLANLFGCGGEELNPAPLDAAVAEVSANRDATATGEDSPPDDGSLDAMATREGSSDGKVLADDRRDAGTRPNADACVPKTCADYTTGTCGQQSDGCGGLTAMCSANDAGGLCPPGQYCGGGGAGQCGGGSSSCGGTACLPHTCSQLGLECGLAGDGCGGLLDCGPCPGSETCGPLNKCIWPADAGPCVPATCGNLGYQCDAVTDGCGNWMDCGLCPVDQYCGGGGGLRRCGGTCMVPNFGDGCVLDCYSADAGGCSAPSCRATRACGVVPNGCGGLVDCGPCPADAGARDALAD